MTRQLDFSRTIL